MKLDKLIEIYQLFFPGVSYVTRLNPDGDEVSYIEGHTKYVAFYSYEINHLEVYKHTLEDTGLITIIEGSPEDIIKLSKLLQ